MTARFFFKPPLIYLITRGELRPKNFAARSGELLRVIEVAVSFGIPLVQLREKHLPAGMLFELAVRAAALTHGSATKLLINDRADVAVAAGAEGVHLTTSSMPAGVVRAGFPDLLIAVSTHSQEEAMTAKRSGADLIVFGPVFESPGKGQPVGISGLQDVASAVHPMPVLALGGIDESNCREAIRAATGFAAIRYLNDEENLRQLGREYYGK